MLDFLELGLNRFSKFRQSQGYP